MAGAGFDLLVADGEHGPIATSDLVQMLDRHPGCRRAGPLPGRGQRAGPDHARPRRGRQRRRRAPDPDRRRRRAGGRLVPLPAGRAARHRPATRLRSTAADTAGYLDTANDLVTCCIQIETREALDDLDAILPVAGDRHDPDRAERPGGRARPHRRHRPPRGRGRDRPCPRPGPGPRSRPGSGPRRPPRPARAASRASRGRRSAPTTASCWQPPTPRPGVSAESRGPLRPGHALPELHLLVPDRDLRVEAERPDLREQRRLRIRVAVDQEDLAREAGVAGPLAGREVRQPGEQLDSSAWAEKPLIERIWQRTWRI